MKKSLILSLAMAVLLVIGTGQAMATDPGCTGADCSASGNFKVDVFAIGGGIDADLATIPNGAAGGIGVAGGVAAGCAEGAFESYEKPIYEWELVGYRTGCWGFCQIPVYDRVLVGYETEILGSAEANIGVTAGGFTNTDAFTFNPNYELGANFDMGIGVGSRTNQFATVGVDLDGNAVGFAHSEGVVGGIAGLGSLDGSILFDSPLCVWDSKGMTYGLAGQGALGLVAGGGVAAGLGSYDLAGNIDMTGNSYSLSYRGIVFNGDSQTEIMGSYVGAFTTVTSDGYADDFLIGEAAIFGGFTAGGFAKTETMQISKGGLATAKAFGSYKGAGQLGCNYSGSAEGYSYTKATTMTGYKGSIMTSGAGMKVSSSPVSVGVPQ